MGCCQSGNTPKKNSEAVKVTPPHTSTPYHNFEAIVKEADDQSNLLQRVHSGIYLDNKRKKYWVDGSGYNAFTLFARSLNIAWGGEPRYWEWIRSKDAFGEAEVDVARLKSVCWFDVPGKIETSLLSPGVDYEVLFILSMNVSAHGWDNLVTLKLECQDKILEEQTLNLEKQINPKGKWVELPVGKFRTSDSMGDVIKFAMFECKSNMWKGGLLVQGVTIRPLKGA
ncbi:Protein PHLOEM PROTEIN 2-LIKE A1 [Acorus gramineus]|uniref:Protein PHLOEM PROTEIN 2-LIKE A1 n=1 Tax=Acorus gramineus TaxID=55184 RepID=A0AAV9AZ99_ACOGR|nr:Protein PHLOEM PROTEIN 2-LIKE A1 [Acorus gramineus]